MENKYFKLLKKIIVKGGTQSNKKGDITFLVNEKLSLSKGDITKIFNSYNVAEKLLEKELGLYCSGITNTAKYNEVGIKWWDYCAPTMVNTYPKYFSRLPELINKINNEKKQSKNYVLFIGETGVITSQLPCLSLIQFQINNKKLFITVYQRSADCNLGLPSDIFQILKISELIDVALHNITFFIGNAHIYNNNIGNTRELLDTGVKPKFNLNV